MKRLVCLILMITMPAFLAAMEPVCSDIVDARARLVCFDRQFPHRDDTAAAAEHDESPESAVVTEPILVTEPIPDRDAPPTVARRDPAPSETPLESPKGLFGDEIVNLTTTIKAVRTGDKQKMVFLLANDEIWMQSTPRPLRFAEGDMVRIKSARLGGYFMHSESGTSTRVRRIR
ncbi:MAG: hypothetical protein O7G86_11270 [Gammaproteobacteria bacterium]|nr:hypothetical protein [Gammaproteobacteria bacterium]